MGRIEVPFLSVANPSSTVGCLSTASFTQNMGPSSTTIGQGDVTGIVSRSTTLPNVTYGTQAAISSHYLNSELNGNPAGVMYEQ